MPLYQPMYSTTARLAPARVGQARASISSPLSEEKNDSARALSQHWPVRPTDRATSQVIGQGEPDHAAGGDVDDGGQVEPPLPRALPRSARDRPRMRRSPTCALAWNSSSKR